MSVVLCELDARGVLQVTLNRPEKGNAFGDEMLARLDAACQQAAQDGQVRMLLLRGSGKHFCVGADLSTPPAAVQSRPVRLVDVCHVLHELRKPSVAVVHGACIGGGLAFASCCDVVVAEASSFFSLPEVRLGFPPGPLIPFLSRAIPARALRRYLLTGSRFTAAEAKAMGLVHELVENPRESAVLAPLVDDLLLGAPQAQAAVKRVLQEVDGQPASRDLTALLQSRLDAVRSSPEAAEGRAAYSEKRHPNWYRK
jgi:methylglutaconyl-CoA hydratase